MENIEYIYDKLYYYYIIVTSNNACWEKKIQMAVEKLHSQAVGWRRQLQIVQTSMKSHSASCFPKHFPEKSTIWELSQKKEGFVWHQSCQNWTSTIQKVSVKNMKL